MITLQNFDNQITGPVLKRGKQYYEDGNVMEISETSKGFWNAEVEGSEFYEVEVRLHKNDEVIDSSCDCPYDGNICKHIIAVLYAIREEKIINIDALEVENPIKLSFQDLLEKITISEYKEFIADYASRNKDFKTTFEMVFADKDEAFDFDKKYTEILRRIVRKYSDHGFVGYREAFGLSKEVSKLLADAENMLQRENFGDAFGILNAVLKEMKDVVICCDDSSGNVGSIVLETISLISNTADAAPLPLKEEIFNFLLIELNDEIYFDYGDFGYEMFEIFEVLALELDRSAAFLNYIDTQLIKLAGEYDTYRKSFFSICKIEFLKSTGKEEEARELILQNLEIVEVRQGEINKFINSGEYSKAKELIEAGIVIADKRGHPGTTSQWEKELLRIAFLENDIELIRRYTKSFAFDSGFSKKYYDQWKATFPTEEWSSIIEDHIHDTIKRIAENNESGRGKFGFTVNSSVLSSVAPVYIEEGYWDRLLELVKKEIELDVILRYHSWLIQQYPEDLLAIYLPAIEHAGDKASARNQYKDLVAKMKKVIKDMPQFKDQILAVGDKLKSKYPRRPAMVDELNRLG